jgi:hypothetical protein
MTLWPPSSLARASSNPKIPRPLNLRSRAHGAHFQFRNIGTLHGKEKNVFASQQATRKIVELPINQKDARPAEALEVASRRK